MGIRNYSATHIERNMHGDLAKQQNNLVYPSCQEMHVTHGVPALVKNERSMPYS